MRTLRNRQVAVCRGPAAKQRHGKAQASETSQHRYQALVLLTMIRVLAYLLSLVFYHRQICSHLRGRAIGFSEFARELGDRFLRLSFDSS